MLIPHVPSPNGNGAVRPVSYEKYLVDTAIELTREIARHFETLEKNLDTKDERTVAGQNSRRAYRAIDAMNRIEVVG
ncbi:MAG: hypothetical protein BWY85_00452 [Firmicutes bacterium ADurb.Bin506]|nr:MAG: hypothetical protein BWY85_00452 [Firmicutes bacterium ADurb.Bin506]